MLRRSADEGDFTLTDAESADVETTRPGVWRIALVIGIWLALVVPSHSANAQGCEPTDASASTTDGAVVNVELCPTDAATGATDATPATSTIQCAVHGDTTSSVATTPRRSPAPPASTSAAPPNPGPTLGSAWLGAPYPIPATEAAAAPGSACPTPRGGASPEDAA
jgi:hypothetical protein